MCLRFRDPKIVKLLRRTNHQILIKVVNMIIQTINLFIIFFSNFSLEKNLTLIYRAFLFFFYVRMA